MLLWSYQCSAVYVPDGLVGVDSAPSCMGSVMYAADQPHLLSAFPYSILRKCRKKCLLILSSQRPRHGPNHPAPFPVSPGRPAAPQVPLPTKKWVVASDQQRQQPPSILELAWGGGSRPTTRLVLAVGLASMGMPKLIVAALSPPWGVVQGEGGKFMAAMASFKLPQGSSSRKFL